MFYANVAMLNIYAKTQLFFTPHYSSKAIQHRRLLDARTLSMIAAHTHEGVGGMF